MQSRELPLYGKKCRGMDSKASFQFRVGKLDLSRYGIGYD